MTATYRIKNWDEHFEIAQSRKLPRLYWVAFPNKHDGKGYRRLLRHPDHERIFAAFFLIIQVASKQPSRGLLADENGPLTAEDLSDATGFAEETFELAFEVLIDPKIGWLEIVNGK